MFGDLILATIPYSTADDVSVDTSKAWVDICPAIGDWADQNKDVTNTQRCNNGS